MYLKSGLENLPIYNVYIVCVGRVGGGGGGKIGESSFSLQWVKTKAAGDMREFTLFFLHTIDLSLLLTVSDYFVFSKDVCSETACLTHFNSPLYNRSMYL